jgi:hypothetical protein
MEAKSTEVTLQEAYKAYKKMIEDDPRYKWFKYRQSIFNLDDVKKNLEDDKETEPRSCFYSCCISILNVLYVASQRANPLVVLLYFSQVTNSRAIFLLCIVSLIFSVNTTSFTPERRDMPDFGCKLSEKNDCCAVLFRLFLAFIFGCESKVSRANGGQCPLKCMLIIKASLVATACFVVCASNGVFTAYSLDCRLHGASAVCDSDILKGNTLDMLVENKYVVPGIVVFFGLACLLNTTAVNRRHIGLTSKCIESFNFLTLYALKHVSVLSSCIIAFFKRSDREKTIKERLVIFFFLMLKEATIFALRKSIDYVEYHFGKRGLFARRKHVRNPSFAVICHGIESSDNGSGSLEGGGVYKPPPDTVRGSSLAADSQKTGHKTACLD